MSLQAYLDNIKEKTGKTPDDFKQLAAGKGLLQPGIRAGEIVAWLKSDFGLGHGHAMAIYSVLKSVNEPAAGKEDAIARHFSGGKAGWQPVFDKLMDKLRKLGDDVQLSPAGSYISILRGDKKMAIVQTTADRMDIGIKCKNAAPDDRFEAAGSWNSMMTHRVRITDAKQLDKELMEWMGNAYEQAISPAKKSKQ